MADLKGEQSRRIRAARVWAGLRREDLWPVVEKGETTYKKIEEGKRRASGPELMAIADKTGVPLWFLRYGWLATNPEDLKRAVDDLPDVPPAE